MKRKRKSFTLIEVMIALALATMCIFYLLEFQHAQIAKQKTQIHAFTFDERLQEASVKLYELLYINQINWSTIQSKKPYVFELDDPNWKACATFDLINEDDTVVPTAMHVKAAITLLYKDAQAPNTQSPNCETNLYFCCVRNAPT